MWTRQERCTNGVNGTKGANGVKGAKGTNGVKQKTPLALRQLRCFLIGDCVYFGEYIKRSEKLIT